MEHRNNLSEFMDVCWKDIFTKLHGAAVYIDHTIAECLHWYTGDKAYSSLKDAGAISVHEIAMYNFCYVKVDSTKKAVIISASPESSFYRRTLKLIIEKNDFEECIIICTADPSVLNLTSISPEGEEDSYKKLKNDVIEWMNLRNETPNARVTVMYKPIFVAAIKESLFVTPPFGHLMPSIDGQLSEECETDVQYFITSFNSFFAQFDAKEDIYALGKLSEHVASKFENSQAVASRRKRSTNQRSVSLILVDRTLDLCMCTSHNTESVMSRILCTLPRLTLHQNDVAINMSPLCPNAEECSSSFIVPGCLATKNNEMLDLLLVKKQKDVLLTLNKMLIEMSSTITSPKTRIATRVSVHSLEKSVHNFRNTESIESLARCSKQLQHIIAVIQALKSEKTSKIELLIGLEKLILQNLAVSRDSSSILSQLSSIVKSRTTRGLDTENLLALLIYIYALSGPDIQFSTQQEDQLKLALIDAVYEDMNKCNESDFSSGSSIYYQTLLLLGITNDEAAKQSAQNIVEQVMRILNLITNQRNNLQNYRNIMTRSSPQEMAECAGLLQRLVSDLLNPEKPKIGDLQQPASTSFSASLNFLSKGKTKHPSDNSWIIIYVLGGITANETKIIDDMISTRNINSPKITLAGSRLLNPSDVLNEVLLPNININ